YLHSLLGSRGAPELVARSGVPRAINREKIDEAVLLRELADADGRRGRVLRGLRRLLRARRGRDAFHPSAPASVPDAPAGVFALRRGAEGEEVVCLHELAGAPADVRLDASGRDLLTGTRTEAGTVRLRPYQVLWLAAEGEPART
ncbi:MAG TPA: DUF3459 domain-containing protein, partial [Alphaproteobacteria bacterium]|nr:DUF3459 domain-containing protein [Alphaproteobacteria bacterium]